MARAAKEHLATEYKHRENFDELVFRLNRRAKRLVEANKLKQEKARDQKKKLGSHTRKGMPVS